MEIESGASSVDRPHLPTTTLHLFGRQDDFPFQVRPRQRTGPQDVEQIVFCDAELEFTVTDERARLRGGEDAVG
jgi:hypothetical protein